MNNNGDLWVKVIQSIQGISGRDVSSITCSKKSGVWLNIVKAGAVLRTFNIKLEELFTRKVGLGDNTLFWEDRWYGTTPFKLLFPDLYMLESNKNCLLSSRLCKLPDGSSMWNWAWSNRVITEDMSNRINELEMLMHDVSFEDKQDAWCWAGEPGGSFLVKSLRMILDNVNNSPFAGICFWNKWLPPRVNCHVWRLLLKRLPTRSNLCARGLNLSTVLCPLCMTSEETVDHLFRSCAIVRDIWNWFTNWCNIKEVQDSNLEHFLLSISDQGKSRNQQKFLEAAYGAVLWFIWKERNNVVFNGKHFSGSSIIVKVQASLFTWIKYRSNRKSIIWFMWCCNPLSFF